MLNHIRKRVPLKVRICKWIIPSPDLTNQLQEKAEDLISKELDLVRFIRRQKMYEIALKVLFSKSELFLIRNQHKPFVLTKADVKEKDGGGSEEDSSDWEPNSIDIEDPTQPFMKTLCRGLYI